MKRLVLFRCEAHGDVGIGHLKRCLNLAATASKRGFTPLICIRHSSSTVQTWLNQASFSVFSPEAEFLPDEIEELDRSGFGEFTAAFIDLSCQPYLDHPEPLDEYLQALGKKCSKRVLIDGLGKDYLTPRLKNAPEFILTPYVNAENLPYPDQSCPLNTLEFFPVDERLLENKTRTSQPERTQNLLVSFGGSDPGRFTEMFLEAFEKIRDSRPNTRVIYGPNFASERIEHLTAMAKDSRGIELLPPQPSLEEHFNWCDAAVISPGLTKYELAFLKIPSLHISANALLAENNAPFTKLGCAQELGSGIDTQTLTARLEAFFANQPLRQSMSNAGANIIDGKGNRRIFDALFPSEQHGSI